MRRNMLKLSVEFPSVAHRDGPAGVQRLARAIEAIGYDHIDIFDHVVMGHALPDRPVGPYAPQMPILEALMTLAYIAAVTTRVTLGTEVLVLPQRQPALVAKQVATLDTLSSGRARLGVGVGWQASEYEALGEDFRTRGARMDDAIGLLRAYWRESNLTFDAGGYRANAMAMEPKPPQGERLPIWVGGNTAPAWRRAGRLGDGWLASRVTDAANGRAAIAAVHRAAEQAGRDPATIGLQSMVAPPPRSAEDKQFYADHARVVARAAELQSMGFGWVALNATAIFQAGARSVDAMIDQLAALHDKLRAATA
ncbi:MAG: TIGR03619 family F420-dependent LLM class oxidoreductase [Gammaproteobacteria bacterium]